MGGFFGQGTLLMKTPSKPDPAQQWLTTFTWQDRLLARFFPRFFARYAPEEIKEQWAAYQDKKRKREGR